MIGLTSRRYPRKHRQASDWRHSDNFEYGFLTRDHIRQFCAITYQIAELKDIRGRDMFRIDHVVPKFTGCSIHHSLMSQKDDRYHIDMQGQYNTIPLLTSTGALVYRSFGTYYTTKTPLTGSELVLCSVRAFR